MVGRDEGQDEGGVIGSRIDEEKCGTWRAKRESFSCCFLLCNVFVVTSMTIN